MNIKLTVELILCNIIFMVLIFYNIKRNRILLKYSIPWIFGILILTFCALTPNFMESIATFLGIETVSNMIFLFIVGINIIITFILTSIISKQKNYCISRRGWNNKGENQS
jgi:hypothetical protein